VLFEGQRVEVGVEHDASVHRRAGAFLVDAVLAGLLTAGALRLWMIAAAPPRRIVHLQDVSAWWIPPAALAVWVVYRALTESGGGTVGKRLFSVHVHHQEGRVGLLRAALRALTAPFDAVLGHLEREGPFDRRQKLRVVKRPHQGWHRWIFPGLWLALATACALWLGITPTSSLVTERRALAAENRCGEVPREVIRFTDRSRDLALTHRCDRVMRSLLARAADGDAAARAELAALPYAQGWRR
jgi:hypothetical protein